MISRRGSILVLALVCLVAIPAAANARPGWQLPRVETVHGDQSFTSTGWHCGPTPFGNYRIRNGVRTAAATRGQVTFRVRIAADGSLHPPRLLGFDGWIARPMRREVRNALNHTVYRYRPGPPALIESLWDTGSLQASRPFDPVRVARARC